MIVGQCATHDKCGLLGIGPDFHEVDIGNVAAVDFVHAGDIVFGFRVTLEQPARTLRRLVEHPHRDLRQFKIFFVALAVGVQIDGHRLVFVGQLGRCRNTRRILGNSLQSAK